MMLIFRALKASETECRIQQITTGNKRGVILLIYKNARADMNILDETVGSHRWQRDHYEVKGKDYCKVSINVGSLEDPRWVGKSDCGSESNMEKEKGESSDSFKRACVNWGIGRELYTAPFIFIPEGSCKIIDSGQGKQKCYDRFYVSEMDVSEDKRITRLVICNASIKKVVYEYNA